MPSETRKLTGAEVDQGYYLLTCGCHVHVFRTGESGLIRRLPPESFEYCDKAERWGTRLDEAEAERQRPPGKRESDG